jgi:hypothetical protein
MRELNRSRSPSVRRHQRVVAGRDYGDGMTDELVDRDLQGARVERVDLTGASLDEVQLAGATLEHVYFRDARFREIDLTRARMRGVELRDAEIYGDLDGLRINTVEVAPLIEAELQRRHPERAKLHPTDAAGYREAWAALEQVWAQTVRRAQALPAELLHESVDGEWSFIETMRHLVFATDSWLRRAILGDPSPWDPWDLPWDEMPDTPGVPRDRGVRPSLEEVLALRSDRQAGVRDYLAGLTDEQLAATTSPVDGPGWPPPDAYPVSEVLGILLNEEFWHRQFAERDLTALTS